MHVHVDLLNLGCPGTHKWLTCSAIHLDTLLGQILACSGLHFNDDESIAKRLYGAFDGDDASRAFGRDIKVVSDGARRHLQHVVRR